MFDRGSSFILNCPLKLHTYHLSKLQREPLCVSVCLIIMYSDHISHVHGTHSTNAGRIANYHVAGYAYDKCATKTSNNYITLLILVTHAN